ncbi:TetR/AcrR family transcriptional regulator [Dyadobacter sp. NIV53]|uniref:TetR/AcrR family transcriptional regulator n=1 Tax=Dyadobacter sp. NIV53 TaxID=2861765 RepID=UPI001C88A81A|nr:TetR/AcrR family transcriptional regulator [Dyadobacter sp. NIV53]
MTVKDDNIRQQILDASRGVFQRYGFAKVTMDDIAKAVHKSRTTLYYYFKNKQEVFMAIVMDESKSLFVAARKNIREDQPFVWNLKEFITVKLTMLSGMLASYHNLATDIRDNKEFFTGMRSQAIAEELSIFKQILKWAIHNHDIALIEGKDLDFLALTLVTAFSSLEQEVIMNGNLADITSRLDWLTAILAKGLK